MNSNKKMNLFIAGMFGTFYAFLTLFPTLTSSKKAEVENGKEYTINIWKRDVSWVPFGNETYLHIDKRLKDEGFRGFQRLDLKRHDFSREYTDYGLDGEVDRISYKENGIGMVIARKDAFETHREYFIQADEHLRQAHERFKDFIDEIERKAGFRQ